MKRLHVHERVRDIDAAVRFYTALFGQSPTVLKTDYAKWQMDDPRVNYAVSSGRERNGIDHLGIQTESEEELVAVSDRLRKADRTLFEEQDAACCYAVSDKAWVSDPDGVIWETFHTMAEAVVMGEDAVRETNLQSLRAEAAPPVTQPLTQVAANGKDPCCG